MLLVLMQIRTRAVSCKQMTMVTPVQLLLFAARTVRTDGEFIQLDSWSVGLTMALGTSVLMQCALCANGTVPLCSVCQWHCALCASGTVPLCSVCQWHCATVLCVPVALCHCALCANGTVPLNSAVIAHVFCDTLLYDRRISALIHRLQTG